LIFLGRIFGKSFFVVLRGLGSNFVIFGGRLIEFCLFPSPPRRLKFYSGLFSGKKPGVSGLLLRTFSPETPETPGKSAEYSDFFLRTFSPETPETPGKSAEIPDFLVKFA
jgi:hypothetical protein